jgi:hypothetical protein
LLLLLSLLFRKSAYTTTGLLAYALLAVSLIVGASNSNSRGELRLLYSIRRQRPKLEEVDIKYTKRYYSNSSVSVVCIADATQRNVRRKAY